MNLSFRSTLTAASLASLLSCTLLSGCRINEHKNDNGKNDNVDISTPFGSMHVNTNGTTDTSAIGITAYPGAVPAKDDDGSNDGAANVNMSFGDFHLGVKAASFQTTDKPDKVLAFYRKDLARYGDVIECRGDKTIGSPTKTAQGLTCSDDGHKHIQTHDPDDNPELRAGSQQHQHIVGIEPKDGGTKIGLVALDLPSNHDSKSIE